MVDLEREISAAIERYEAGDLASAEGACRNILAARPSYPPASHLLGLAALQRGDSAGAERLMREAIAGEPGKSLYRFNLGNVLAAAGRHEDAAQAYVEAIERDPGYVPALFNLGQARMDLGDFRSALDAFSRAIAIQPGFADALAGAVNAHVRLGFDLSGKKRPAEALESFAAALRLAPANLDAMVGYGNSLGTLGRAQESFEKLLECAEAHGPHPALASGAIAALDYVPVVAEENIRLRRRLAGALRGGKPASRPSRTPSRGRLRIGYLSAHFFQHVDMRLFTGVLRRHDASAFEVHVYDATLARDSKTQELRQIASHWHEVDRLSDDEIAARIRADGIDILLDLAGHLSGNRLGVMARRPAPIQASWLGYPGSTGMEEIDYLISDPHTSPPQLDRYCSERILRLPRTRFCYEPLHPSPAPVLPAGDAPITFGSFNNPCKLNPKVLDLWARILDAVPGSRLISKHFLLDHPATREWQLKQMAQAGIDPARVELRGATDYHAMLQEYSQVHVALDPFPYCGGMTSLDALWMGVPVVTLEQPLIAGRQTISFLRNIGHPRFIAGSDEDYVRIAVDCAADRARLERLRSTLRVDMEASPLMDFGDFTRELENAYRAMARETAP